MLLQQNQHQINTEIGWVCVWNIKIDTNTENKFDNFRVVLYKLFDNTDNTTQNLYQNVHRIFPNQTE